MARYHRSVGQTGGFQRADDGLGVRVARQRVRRFKPPRLGKPKGRHSRLSCLVDLADQGRFPSHHGLVPPCRLATLQKTFILQKLWRLHQIFLGELKNKAESEGVASRP